MGYGVMFNGVSCDGRLIFRVCGDSDLISLSGDKDFLFIILPRLNKASPSLLVIIPGHLNSRAKLQKNFSSFT